MKLYIKQKVLSFADRFTVKDEYGDDRYRIEGEVFSFGRKLHVYDMSGMEAAYIEQKVWAWMPCYNVYIQGRNAAEIRRKFTWFHPGYEISGPDWTVEGSFWEHEYEIISPSRGAIVRIAKEWMTWGDSYVLEIDSPADELLALAVVLTIDCVVASQSD